MRRPRGDWSSSWAARTHDNRVDNGRLVDLEVLADLRRKYVEQGRTQKQASGITPGG
jgi:hypothetical protein